MINHGHICHYEDRKRLPPYDGFFFPAKKLCLKELNSLFLAIQNRRVTGQQYNIRPCLLGQLGNPDEATQAERKTSLLSNGRNDIHNSNDW